MFRALSFEAKNDFFDLKRIIKLRSSKHAKKTQENNETDKQAKTKSNHAEEKLKKIMSESLDNNYRQMAYFHKAVTSLVEEKYIIDNPANWEENELVIKVAFDYAHEVFHSPKNKLFEDPSGVEIKDEVIRDLNSYLERLEAFSVQNEREETINNASINIKTYTYSGLIQQEPPEHVSDLVEYERRFKEIYEQYTTYIETLHSIYLEQQKLTSLNNGDCLSNEGEFAHKLREWGCDAHSNIS